MVYAAELPLNRKGSFIRNSVYLQMSSVLKRLKNKIILKTPEVKIMRNFVSPEVAEFRGIRGIM
jgi:hypothetical protein